MALICIKKERKRQKTNTSKGYSFSKDDVYCSCMRAIQAVYDMKWKQKHASITKK